MVTFEDEKPPEEAPRHRQRREGKRSERPRRRPRDAAEKIGISEEERSPQRRKGTRRDAGEEHAEDRGGHRRREHRGGTRDGEGRGRRRRRGEGGGDAAREPMDESAPEGDASPRLLPRSILLGEEAQLAIPELPQESAPNLEFH